MKKLCAFLVLAAFPAFAAVNCNQPNLEYLNDSYVCLSSEFKEMNNQIQEIEDRLRVPPGWFILILNIFYIRRSRGAQGA